MKKITFALGVALAAGILFQSVSWAEETKTAKAPAAATAGTAKTLKSGDSANAANTIKLKVVAVNPSAEKSQKVPIRIYLPKEIIPDDIVDMGELQVGYDTEKSVYYAFSEGVELKPQETRVFQVTLEDVWRVPDEETSKIKLQTERALKYLQKTEYYPQAKSIVDSINTRLDEIKVKQEDLSISRETHIGAYRVNMMTMESVKKDVNIIEKLLMHTGAPPSIDFLRDTVFEEKKDLDRVTALKLILAIIGVLALLGGGFYLRWFLMLKPGRRLENLDAAPTPFISERIEEHVGISPTQIDNEKKNKKEAS